MRLHGFMLPEVEFERQLFSSITDSGQMVATANRTRCLTAAKVAKALYRKRWPPHWSTIVTISDRATLRRSVVATNFSMQGVQNAYSQALHHPCKGKAGHRGVQLHKQLQEQKEGVSMVETLSTATDLLNDKGGAGRTSL